jgi:hypothetical protein
MIVWTILLLVLKMSCMECLTLAETVNTLKKLKMQNPIIFADQLELPFTHQLIKRLSNLSQTALVTNNANVDDFKFKLLLQPGLWIGNLASLHLILNVTRNNINDSRIGSVRPFTIFVEDIHQIKKFSHLKIDQLIYFITKKDLRIHEIYTVNEVKIEQEVGWIDANLTLWSNNAQTNVPDYLTRRSNFQGLVMKVMIEEQLPFIIFPRDFETATSTIESDIPLTYRVCKFQALTLSVPFLPASTRSVPPGIHFALLLLLGGL